MISCLYRVTRYHRYRTTITITGNAQNIKGRAALIAGPAGVFYLDGLEEWDHQWLNHTIKVTGDLDRKIIRKAVILLL
jgi:hypothetical protein